MIANAVTSPIIIQTDIDALTRDPQLKQILARFKQIVIITNVTVAPLYLHKLQANFASGIEVIRIVIPDGEAYKNSATYHDIIDQLLEHGVKRNSLIIALGGGVISDLAGFVAATYLRGVALINIPTTFLAQVDAAVGGKVGINHNLGKNLLGTFYLPLAIVIDLNCLATQSDRHFFAGMAEVIKYGLCLDKTLFEYIETNLALIKARNSIIIGELVRQSIKLKTAIMLDDLYDTKNERVKLNFGHTIGHALEQATDYQVLHGEAVAIGMCLELELSQATKVLFRQDNLHLRLARILRAINLPTSLNNLNFNKLELLAKIESSLKLDKKHCNNHEINYVALMNIGSSKLSSCSYPELIKLLNG